MRLDLNCSGLEYVNLLSGLLLRSCFRLWLYCLLRLNWRLVFNHLKKYFILLNHAEFTSGSFFNSSFTAFQITHFCIEHCVARFQAGILFLLCIHLTVEFPHAQPAPLAQPQRILQQSNQDNEDQREGFQL